MKLILLSFFILLSTTALGRDSLTNAADTCIIKRKRLGEIYFLVDENRDDIRGEMRLKTNIESDTILFYCDLLYAPLEMCSKGSLDKNYKPNTITINRNRPFDVCHLDGNN